MEAITVDEKCQLKRTIWIVSVWVVYIGFGGVSGMFYMDKLGIFPSLTDVMYHAFAIHGYTMFGCFFFAPTAEKDKSGDLSLARYRQERFIIAYGVSLVGPVMVMLIVIFDDSLNI